MNLGKLYGRLTEQGIRATVDDLRDRDLKWVLEQKQAALFSYCIGYSILKKPIAYAMSEDGDYDCILWWKDKSESRFAPVQLKETVPAHRNLNTSIETELAKLRKYSATDTIVAVHINTISYLAYLSINKPEN